MSGAAGPRRVETSHEIRITYGPARSATSGCSVHTGTDGVPHGGGMRMRDVRTLKFLWIGVAASCSVFLWSCDEEALCENSFLETAVYMERVNCDQGGMCVTEDEPDTVDLMVDSEDPLKVEFQSSLTGQNAEGTICGDVLTWRTLTGSRIEEGTFVFADQTNTYTRSSNYTLANPGETGSCTGTGSKVGPPGPPKQVGVCPTGGGGDCIPFSTTVGGTELAPVVWEERYTCVDASGACFGSENTEVVLELIQANERIEWSIAEGEGTGSQYAGDLCDTSFEWTSGPETPEEEGCWGFTADRFNKRSFGSGFFCIGSGSKGAGSIPVPTPSCAEIAAANVDFSACPKPPPASPIEDDPPQCVGQLIVEPMSNNVPCTTPDVSPCSGCNDYCLDNGFPFGSTTETCEASVCQCGCTYCRPN